ncbi:uncharacterized protein [Hetaerina americana]|uniref:uncharacterized protein n=1 Tax=Hetaerina americana TaxID=62018 RepID=UPI003A7F1676
MPRERMDNTAFEGGEAVLLAARGLPNRETLNGGGTRGGGRRPPGDRTGGGSVALEVGMGDDGTRPSPPVTQTNGGPKCPCVSQEDGANGGDYREGSKSPTNPMPIVAQESPWHRHKSIYLGAIVVTLVLWVIIYTIISELNLA